MIKNINELEQNSTLQPLYVSIKFLSHFLTQIPDITIENVDEFIEFLRKLDSISIEDKTGLVIYLLNSNLEYYKTNSGIKEEKKKDDELDKIVQIMNKNKNLLSPAYDAVCEKIGKRLDLSLKIDDLVEERVLNKINIRNIIRYSCCFINNF